MIYRDPPFWQKCITSVSVFVSVQVRGPDGILTHRNRKTEYHQNICGFSHYVQEILSINMEIWVRGGLPAPQRFQVIKQPEINWLHGDYVVRVDLTQAQRPLSVLYYVFSKLQSWRETVQIYVSKKCVLASHIVWLIRQSFSDKWLQWYTVKKG